MISAYIILTLVSVSLWLPILRRFYKSWMGRRNPVSLAICAMIMMAMWAAVAGVWLICASVSAPVVMFTTTGLSSGVAVFAHFSFHWAQRRFPENRSD